MSALRQITLRYKLRATQMERDALHADTEKLDVRKVELNARASELDIATGELCAQTPQEERDALAEQIQQYESQCDAYEIDRAKNDGECTRVDGELEALREQIQELVQRTDAAVSVTRQTRGNEPTYREERQNMPMNTQARAFRAAYSMEQRENMARNSDIKEFLSRMRAFKGQNRAVTSGELNIPDFMLGILRDNLHRYSKLIKHVNVRPVGGVARINILGTIPEAIWMEAQGTLNEMGFGFNQVELDGYMVGGFIPVHDTLLEDSDVNLFTEVFDMLGQSIGYATDKAILFGTGTKMPVGIFTRLKAATQPAWWGVKAPTFTDLSTAHILKTSSNALDDTKFFKELVAAMGKAKSDYSNGTKFWAMNSNTYAALMGKMVQFNMAGALVSSWGDTMPIVGGAIEKLDFIPDNMIVGGYGSLYVLAERSGAKLDASPHVRFLQNTTVFRGIARYDGKPVIGEGFVAFSMTTTAPTDAGVTFATDVANTAQSGI